MPTSLDPHGGPPPPVYRTAQRLGEDVSQYVTGGALKRYGVIEAVDAYTTNDTATVTINGIRMPYLQSYSPSVGDRVCWLQQEDNRICIGEYGRERPRIKVWLSTGVSPAPGTFDLYFDGNSITDQQDYFDHSTSFFPYLFGCKKRGLYDVYGGISYAAGDGNIRILGLKQNGTIVWSKATTDCNTLFATAINFCIPMNLNTGDTLSLNGTHNASGALALGTGWATTYFAAIWRQNWL